MFGLTAGYYFDNRLITDKTIDWKKIRKGDVVLEGIKNHSYRVLTSVDNEYWEYFDDGYFKSTSPEYCHWLVVGQKNAGGELIQIVYNRER